MTDEPQQERRQAERRAGDLDPRVEAAIRAAVRSAAIVELRDEVGELARETARYRRTLERRLRRRSWGFWAAVGAFLVLFAGQAELLFDARRQERSRRQDVAEAVVRSCESRKDLEAALLALLELSAQPRSTDSPEELDRRRRFLEEARARITSPPCETLSATILRGDPP